MMQHHVKTFVIVGGGAGGLELSIRLSQRLKKHKVILVNDRLTHVWKPLLHEIAAGTMNPHEDELDFLALAEQHGFYFELGRFVGLDRNRKKIYLENKFIAMPDREVVRRELAYDVLVIAIGSQGNDFKIPGVREHAIFLDDYLQAERFHQRLIDCLFVRRESEPEQLNIAIIGGGATGVELAAELHYALTNLRNYHFSHLCLNAINITLIEANKRVLSALPEYLSQRTQATLEAKGIKILVDERVASVSSEGVYTQSKLFIPAHLTVWAAGIKGADILTQLDGLAYNSLNQLQVKGTLQSVTDALIFALGDCAACPLAEGKWVPARAQAAYQEAQLLAKSLTRWVQGKSLLTFKYRDYGSLISLSRYTTVGQLMYQRNFKLGLEGYMARLLYQWLYRRHQMSVLGWWKALLLNLAKRLLRPVKHRLKLH